MNHQIRKEFANERILLNGSQFAECKFRQCELVFNGVGPVGLQDCEFDGCRWTFVGPAADTIAFLTELYKSGGGGRDVILGTLKQIARDHKLHQI